MKNDIAVSTFFQTQIHSTVNNTCIVHEIMYYMVRFVEQSLQMYMVKVSRRLLKDMDFTYQFITSAVALLIYPKCRFVFFVLHRITIMSSSVILGEIDENTKLGRENALLGNYDTSLVYYQGVLQQIQKLLGSINESDRRRKWSQVLI